MKVETDLKQKSVSPSETRRTKQVPFDCKEIIWFISFRDNPAATFAKMSCGKLKVSLMTANTVLFTIEKSVKQILLAEHITSQD